MKLTSKYKKALSKVGTWPARRKSRQLHRFEAPKFGVTGWVRSHTGNGAGFGNSGKALHLAIGRQFDVHVVPLDTHREDLDPVRIAAEARTRFE